MNKIAQRRGVFNKIREKLNAPGEALSGVFSPEFTRLMDTLRQVDDDAREKAIDLKDMLKVAKSNFNRREYMTCISYLGKFHERIDEIKLELTKLNREAHAVHNEFLFGELDNEHKEFLFNKMPERFKAKPVAKKADTGKADDGMSKEAGVKDWWHNITSDRGKSLKHWEQRFPKEAKELKRQTERMLNRSEMFLNLILSTFKQLATFRATRKLEDYIKLSDTFIAKFGAYDAAFSEYFNGAVKKYIDAQRDSEQRKAESDAARSAVPATSSEVPVVLDPNAVPVRDTVMDSGPPSGVESVTDSLKEDLNSPKVFPTRDSDPPQSVIPVAKETGPVATAPTTPAPPKPVAKAPLSTYPPPVSINPEQAKQNLKEYDLENPSFPPPPRVPTITTQEFIDKITKLSNGNPAVLSLEILRFAKTIEKTDKPTSERLLAIAKSLTQ